MNHVKYDTEIYKDMATLIIFFDIIDKFSEHKICIQMAISS
jgi:hypothetical protein